MSKIRLVVITDCIDVAANEIRAVLVSELEKIGAEDKVEVEPIVNAKEFSLINGAFLTRLMADNYQPNNTIFLVILNPLTTERKDRARIIGETNNGFKFVGENTGTLGWLIKDFGVKQIFESSQEGLKGQNFISFGGKYIHAPIAAKIASGIPLSELGVPFDSQRLSYPTLEDGVVLHIDNFGVPKIYTKLDNPSDGDKYEIFVNNTKRCEAIFTFSMKALPDNTIAIYYGSSINNYTELGKVRCLDTSKELDINIGDIIKFDKINN